MKWSDLTLRQRIMFFGQQMQNSGGGEAPSEAFLQTDGSTTFKQTDGTDFITT